MSFTSQIKEEISSIKNTKSETIAELSGFIRNNGYFLDDLMILTTENEKTVERMKNFIKDLYDYNVEIQVIDNLNFSKKDLYSITFEHIQDKLLKDIAYIDEKGEEIKTPPTYIVGGNEEIRAYLRGTFLSCGSINDPKTSRYHMELLIEKPEEAVFVQKLINIFELNSKILNREKGYMIYIKEAEKISDFIKIIGANNSVIYFENERVIRDKKNQTNRLNNMEQANMDKIIQTATIQLEEIETIERLGSIELLDDKARVALEYRKKYPEVSLKELAEIISVETGKTITKSGLNHRLRKIKELAERLRKMEEKKN